MGTRKVNPSLKAWTLFVKKVAKEENISYKEAMTRAKIRKDKGEKWMKGGSISSSSSSSASLSSLENREEEEEEISTSPVTSSLSKTFVGGKAKTRKAFKSKSKSKSIAKSRGRGRGRSVGGAKSKSKSKY